jgi:hypothetical protein
MKPGDDLSYYLGPSAKRATRKQCDELRGTFANAHAMVLLKQWMAEDAGKPAGTDEPPPKLSLKEQGST